MMKPGMATIPKACFQPHCVAMTPPRADADGRSHGDGGVPQARHPRALFDGVHGGYHRGSAGRVSCLTDADTKPREKELREGSDERRQDPVATLQSITMTPTLRFLLHLSTRMETGNVNADNGQIDRGRKGSCLRVGDAEILL